MSKYFKLLTFCLIIFLFSCNNYRYFYHQADFISLNDTIFNKNELYMLQPYDYLYISIKSTNKDVNELFDRISSQYSTAQQNNESNFFLTGYVINDSGFVFIPTIGNLYVKNLTISQAKNLIESKIKQNVQDAIINVRLANFVVSFLGEVQNNGRIQFYKENLNILEALADVGGISYYGDKKNVKIFRQQQGKTIIYNIDLTNKNLIQNPKFYLQPNDIVYVPPRKQKEIIDFMRDYSFFITVATSTISTTIIILQLLKK